MSGEGYITVFLEPVQENQSPKELILPKSVNNEEFRQRAAALLQYPVDQLKFFVPSGIYLYSVEDLEVNFRQNMVFQYESKREEGQG